MSSGSGVNFTSAGGPWTNLSMATSRATAVRRRAWSLAAGGSRARLRAAENTASSRASSSWTFRSMSRPIMRGVDEQHERLDHRGIEAREVVLAGRDRERAVAQRHFFQARAQLVVGAGGHAQLERGDVDRTPVDAPQEAHARAQPLGVARARARLAEGLLVVAARGGRRGGRSRRRAAAPWSESGGCARRATRRRGARPRAWSCRRSRTRPGTRAWPRAARPGSSPGAPAGCAATGAAAPSLCWACMRPNLAGAIQTVKAVCLLPSPRARPGRPQRPPAAASGPASRPRASSRAPPARGRAPTARTRRRAGRHR